MLGQLPFAPPPTPEEELAYRKWYREALGRDPEEFEINAFRVIQQTDSSRRLEHFKKSQTDP